MRIETIFKRMEEFGCREVRLHLDAKTGMKVILAIDSMGESASGGTRFAHTEAAKALDDALGLAKAMGRKTKVLGVEEGGAKAVVLADRPKTREFLEAVGDFIEFQRGTFRTAVDLGFSLEDAEVIATRTRFIDSLSHSMKGLGSTGETTAEGMVHGLEVVCPEFIGKPISDCTFGVMGLGAVGMALVRRLLLRGCGVVATDIDQELCEEAERLGAVIVEDIFTADVDVFSPCAMGGVLDEITIPKLRCKVVAGGANCILADEIKGERQLLARGITFIPEFVLHAGGFLQALVERKGGTIEEAAEKSRIVGRRIEEVVALSKAEEITLMEAARELFGSSRV